MVDSVTSDCSSFTFILLTSRSSRTRYTTSAVWFQRNTYIFVVQHWPFGIVSYVFLVCFPFIQHHLKCIHCYWALVLCWLHFRSILKVLSASSQVKVFSICSVDETRILFVHTNPSMTSGGVYNWQISIYFCFYWKHLFTSRTGPKSLCAGILVGMFHNRHLCTIICWN